MHRLQDQGVVVGESWRCEVGNDLRYTDWVSLKFLPSQDKVGDVSSLSRGIFNFTYIIK